MSPISQNINIEVYNAVGQKVTTIFTGEIVSGTNEFTTSLEALANGIYYIKINGDSVSKTVKITKN